MAPRQDPRQKQFHWVNKDLESSRLSRSQGQEATSILRFVQQNRPKPRRGRRKCAEGTKPHDFVAFETEVIPEISRSTDVLTEETSQAASELKYDTTISTFRAMQSRWRVTRIPVNNITEGSAFDPFVSSVVPITAPMYSVIQFARKAILNGAGGYKLSVFSDQLKPMGEMYEAAVHYTLHSTIRYKHIIYPLLAAFSRFMPQADALPTESSQHPDLYLQLGSEAVRTAITEHMGNKDILSSVATGVHFLVSAAALSGRTEEVMIHLNAFLKFLPYVNTKTLVGYWEVDLMHSWAVRVAIVRDQAPLIKVAICDPGHFPPSRMARFRQQLEYMRGIPKIHSTLDADVNIFCRKAPRLQFDLLRNPLEDFDLDLGSSLETLVHTHQFYSAMLPIVRNVLDCLTVAKIIWRAPEIATKQDADWLCKRSRVVLHESLSLAGVKRIDTSTFGGQQAACFRQTLNIVLMGVISRQLHFSRRELADRLRGLLVPIVELDWRTQQRQQQQEEENGGTEVPVAASSHLANTSSQFNEHEMLLWMLLTGYWIAAGTPDSEWFAEHAANVAVRRLSLKGYDDLHVVMTKYLYSKTVQRESLEQIASSISVDRQRYT